MVFFYLFDNRLKPYNYKGRDTVYQAHFSSEDRSSAHLLKISFSDFCFIHLSFDALCENVIFIYVISARAFRKPTI